MHPERREHLFKPCPFKGCDWHLVQSWFVGGPGTIVPVPAKVQELQVISHLISVHGHSGPPSKIFV